VAETVGLRAVVGECIIDFPTPSCAKPEEALKKTLDFNKQYKKSELISLAVAPHSVYACRRELLVIAADQARSQGLLVNIHVSETKKEVEDCIKEHGKTPVEYLDEIGFLSGNVIAAHSVWLSDSDLEIFKKRGVKVSHNPISNMKLASGIMSAAEMINKGIIVGLGTDSAASNNTLDLFSDMRTCALLHKVNKLEPTAANARQVAAMATINGAKALGLVNKIGSLEVGKRADIITISLNKPHLVPIYDPYSHLVYCVNGGDVSDVIVNGKVLMRDREVKTIDEEKVLAEAKNFKF